MADTEPIEELFRTGAALEGPEGTMRVSLIRTVAELEALPEDIKEHPGSNGLVKNLINPSLYPFEKGQSIIIPEDKAPKDGSSVLPTRYLILLSPVEEEEAAEKIFERCKSEEDPDFDDTYQWLPADLWIDAEGNARFLSYINNLNPVDFAEAYACIEAIFSALLPQFEAVLKVGVPLRSRRLQVIVKMMNTELTPEKPKYPGGEFHVEGRDNESIKALGLYYYSVSNIKASSLELKRRWPPRGCRARRRDADAEDVNDADADADDANGAEADAVDADPPQTLPTTENSFIVARNDKLMHKVPEYMLDDPAKPGHRKVLAFFLCDPEKEVLSTGRVPPQQRWWYLRELEESFPPTTCALDVLWMMVAAFHGTISQETALLRRTEMLAKRDRDARDRRDIPKKD